VSWYNLFLYSVVRKLKYYSRLLRCTSLNLYSFSPSCDGEDQAKAQKYNGVYLKNIKLQKEEVKSKGANIQLLAKSLVSRS
jgi:hypothetical protein